MVDPHLLALRPGVIRKVLDDRIVNAEPALALEFENGCCGELLGERSEHELRVGAIRNAVLAIREPVPSGVDDFAVTSYEHRSGEPAEPSVAGDKIVDRVCGGRGEGAAAEQ